MDTFSWFDYPMVVQPHHTDYGGIVWHGTYVAWLEEARVAYLMAQGLSFADWVKAGVDLPVVNLSLHYRQSLRLGDQAVVRTRLEPLRGVRLVWHYQIQQTDTQMLCVEAQVTLATVDLITRKPLRRLPSSLRAILP
ncbi:MAG: thioesterase family protein [Cyanobacteriota bacterium]|nr:thioesterase family protein [Cyanobacteriota bacterium]